MKIGIQISSDFKKKTGVEEYVYQLVKHLPKVNDSRNHQLFLFTPHQITLKFDPVLPNKVRNIIKYERKNLKWPLKKGWTQIRLSLEMLKNYIDILFVPAHSFPLICPKKLVVAIQGLEFERVPEYYSFWQRKKLRFLTKRNAKRAEKIIVPSECTKKDLIKFYNIDPKKIFIVYHGVNRIENYKPALSANKLKIQNSPKYILYLGTDNKRKNIKGLIKAFEILKKKYKIPHKLFLAGPKKSLKQGPKHDILFMGYVGEKEKSQLLKNADVFAFPSFYEGFGFPVLEAQVAGTAVVASNISSLPEILNNSALLVNPKKPEEIAKAIYKIISNPELRKSLIKKGQENIKRFSWQTCAQETLKIISKPC